MIVRTVFPKIFQYLWRSTLNIIRHGLSSLEICLEVWRRISYYKIKLCLSIVKRNEAHSKRPVYYNTIHPLFLSKAKLKLDGYLISSPLSLIKTCTWQLLIRWLLKHHYSQSFGRSAPRTPRDLDDLHTWQNGIKYKSYSKKYVFQLKFH